MKSRRIDDIESITFGLLDINDLGALWLEAERHRPQLRQLLADTRVILFARVQQQESAAAGARDFSADRAVCSGDLVPAIDLRIARSLRHGLLDDPAFMQDFPECGEI